MVLGAFAQKLDADRESTESVGRRQREDMLRLLTYAVKNVPRFKGMGEGASSSEKVFDCSGGFR